MNHRTRSSITNGLRVVGPQRWPLLGCIHCLALIALCVLTAPLARSEAVREEDDTAQGAREIIRMTVTPADEPTPAFKYRLTYRPHELKPGNSVAHYMRSFPEGGVQRTWQTVREKYGESVDEWYAGSTPLSQLPIDDFKNAARSFDGLVENHMQNAARARDTDWGVNFEDIKGTEIITFLLPEIQSMREIERAMSLQTRLAILEGRYDDAIDLMRMSYRLGRDVGQQPILVSNLVGIAICSITNMDVVDLIAAPNSPNMYWALTELPRPQVSLRDSLRLELAIGPRMFEFLDSPETKNLTHDEWNALWKRSARLTQMVHSTNFADDSLAAEFQPLLFGLLGYAHARDRLFVWGYSTDEIDAMAVGQVLSIYSARAYQTFADEWEKVAYFDYLTGKKLYRNLQQLEEDAGWFGSGPDRELVPIASPLLPAVHAAQSAVFRSERDLDALRVIEALRMHAAQNEGRWPKNLDEITCVPVPRNVATGEQFEYRLDGDTAILVLPMSDGFHQEKQYELTLAK
jgi:hypothetical protein